LGFGSEAEVLDPPELRAKIAAQTAAMARQYDRGTVQRPRRRRSAVMTTQKSRVPARETISGQKK